MQAKTLGTTVGINAFSGSLVKCVAHKQSNYESCLTLYLYEAYLIITGIFTRENWPQFCVFFSRNCGFSLLLTKKCTYISLKNIYVRTS